MAAAEPMIDAAREHETRPCRLNGLTTNKRIVVLVVGISERELE